MNKNDILNKSLAKAARGGYQIPGEIRSQWYSHGWDATMDWMLEKIIFSEEFAKSFWGDKPICNVCGSAEFEGGVNYVPGEPDDYWSACKGCGAEPVDILEFGNNDGTTYPAFVYHLREMVTYSRYLAYIEKFI